MSLAVFIIMCWIFKVSDDDEGTHCIHCHFFSCNVMVQVQVEPQAIRKIRCRIAGSAGISAYWFGAAIPWRAPEYEKQMKQCIRSKNMLFVIKCILWFLDVMNKVIKIHKTYGPEPFKIWMGTTFNVVISKPDDVQVFSKAFIYLPVTFNRVSNVVYIHLNRTLRN